MVGVGKPGNVRAQRAKFKFKRPLYSLFPSLDTFLQMVRKCLSSTVVVRRTRMFQRCEGQSFNPALRHSALAVYFCHLAPDIVVLCSEMEVSTCQAIQ